LTNDFSTKLDLVTEQDGITVIATLSYPTMLHRQNTTTTYHVTGDSLGSHPAAAP
jgi:hypothetical protein